VDVRRQPIAVFVLGFAVLMSGCAKRVATPAPGPPASRIVKVQEGLASYYAEDFHGKLTASGRPFDMHAMVAAHPSFPFGTLLRVTNLANGRSVQVSVLDRGPAREPQREGVIIDVSRRAAERLGFIRQGRVRVRLEVLKLGVANSRS
jgi:rare lipoprotein A